MEDIRSRRTDSAELSRQLFYAGGSQAWPITYKIRPNNDQHALEAILRRTQQLGVDDQTRKVGDVIETMGHAVMHMISLARWVDGGCRILTTDATYFAAMAHTTINRDSLDALRVPWPAFLVEWPRGLCVAEDGFEYTCALVAQFDSVSHRGFTKERGAFVPNGAVNVGPLASLMITGERVGDSPALTSDYPGVTLNTLLFEDLPVAAPLFGDYDARSDGDKEIMEMVKRAIAGLLYTMQHTRNWRTSPFKSPLHRRAELRAGPPPHRVIQIGRPLSIDMTIAVRERAAGRKSTSPSVQTLVRGHVKRQVVGVGRSARKVIWIEPYWRGPEDAPILARPHHVAPRST